MVAVADSLSGTLSRWVCAMEFGDVPAKVIADAKLRILDTVGVIAAASVTDAGNIVRVAALKLGPGTASRILGFGDRAAPAFAAVANGTMAHVHDFDDTHGIARMHISAPVVTTALTLGEANGADGKSFLLAIVAGSEIAARLGAMEPGAFHDRGYHATGVLGAIGAAFTAGKLMALSPAHMQNAIGIAASQAAGIAEPFADGTWTKRLHPGWAAHCGIAAAQLAACGFTGPAKALDGTRGLFNAHLGPTPHPYERVIDGLGDNWLCMQSSFKPYPCGHLIHPFIEAIYTLREEAGLRANDVAQITCYLSPWVMPMVGVPREGKLRPADDAAAKISIYYCIAAACLRNKVDLAAFAPETIRDERLLALADKVFCEADPAAPPDQSQAKVVVERIGGETSECVVTNGLGSEANPMSPNEVRQKFIGNMMFAALGANAERVIGLAEKFEFQASVKDLVELCCRD